MVGLQLKRFIKTIVSRTKVYPVSKNDSVTIIGYHRVVADIKEAEANSIYGLVVSTATFREHCRILKENFDVVSLETATRFLKNGQKSERPKAVITFDDGYLDNYTQAFPVLKELDLPATIFLPTKMIGKDDYLAHDKAFWLAKNAIEQNLELTEIFRQDDVAAEFIEQIRNIKETLALTEAIVYLPSNERDQVIRRLEEKLSITDYPRQYALLDWKMVRKMNRHRITFGDHTATHPVLPLEDKGSFEKEIIASKKTLEKKLNRPATMFAYPNGEYNAAIRRQIIKAGYQVAVTTDKRVNRNGTDLYALGRTCLCEESTRGISGKFSRQVAKFRFGTAVISNPLTAFLAYPVRKLWAVSRILTLLLFFL